MSRIVRISVSESIERVVHIDDGVATKIELLPILPPERMREHLAAELAADGLEVKDGIAAQDLPAEGGGTIQVRVVLETGEVTVRVSHEQEIKLKKTVDGQVDEDYGKAGRDGLREAAKRALEKDAKDAEAKLQQQGTETLEGALRDLRPKIDGVVHRATSRALKEKAAQMGEVQETSEDGDSLVIKVKV